MTRIPRVLVLIAVTALAGTGCDLLSSPPDPPGRPPTLVADARSQSSVLLTWSAPNDGGELAEYEVERASGGDFEQVATPGPDATTYTDTGLASEQTYSYRVRACNDGGCSEYSRDVDARTFGVLEVTTTELPDGMVGQPYTAGLDAEGAGSSHDWAIISGALPDGLTLNGGTGIISGTPTTVDTAGITVRATSIDDQTADASLTLEILPPPAVAIVTPALAPVIVDGEYHAVLEATGGGADRVWTLASGALPAGLTLSETGTIIGTPTATDTAAVAVRVESAGESDERAYTLAVVTNDDTRFNISAVAVSEIPPTIQPHVDSALARWERAITGDVQAGSIPPGTFSSSSCSGFGGVTNGTTLDDIIILINIASIDGPGNILGQAGPCSVRSDGSTDPNIPATGLLTLDADDLLPMTGTETLTALVFHELGHVLGYGALWSGLGLVEGDGTEDPRYTGSAAVAEYGSLGGAGDVPLENTGSQGTAEVHWRETDFDHEIMTGYSEAVGIPQPLSRVSIASMEDLGYTVDLDEADTFTLADALAWTADGDRGHDLLLDTPILVIDPDGTLRPAPFHSNR